ncbi:hypothetical protein GGI07_004432 [Coemansia sp. Benny D115]|nr:hypothetical protein GGI07_004432 [Coemansia sp. Benny D115]
MVAQYNIISAVALAIASVVAVGADAVSGGDAQAPHNVARSAEPHSHSGSSHHSWGRRCGGCGGWGCGLCGGVGLGGWNGGWNGGFVGGGWGFPFASNAVNQFDRNTNCAQCVDNTLFTNNRAANVANDNVHCCNSANIIA